MTNLLRRSIGAWPEQDRLGDAIVCASSSRLHAGPPDSPSQTIRAGGPAAWEARETPPPRPRGPTLMARRACAR